MLARSPEATGGAFLLGFGTYVSKRAALFRVFDFTCGFVYIKKHTFSLHVCYRCPIFSILSSMFNIDTYKLLAGRPALGR